MSFLCLLLSISTQALALDVSERWTEIKSGFFADREINNSETVISLEAPKRAYDLAIVPIVVHAENDAREIKKST